MDFEGHTIKEILIDTETRMKKSGEVLSHEFSTVRTGRATPALVDGIRVDYFGTPTPLKSLAAISTPDAKLIVIQPWDATVCGDIEKAILKSDLGITPVNDGKLIRLQIPDLSKERRIELAKVVKKMAEDGRISVRNVRHAAIEHLKKIEKEKIITEDEKFTGQDAIQKLTDKYIAKVEELLAAKEKEITEI
ncbi:MAG: ribosome recycling factor [Candidatus Omnitrophica bacterium]|nr:ribosome recycling factor [Candidatus Omnitrophota bacterium]MDD5311391.1 ribosome recycling factor [Candidatus Omnitrophota bacterium]MDD5546459.1 ribosome recycling factor [Candidatus Omnitrophota bacterium]